MTRRGAWAPVVGVAVLAVLAVIGVTVAPPAAPTSRASRTTVPVDVSTMVCPRLSGGSVSATTMTVTDVSSVLGRSGKRPTVTYVSLNATHPRPIPVIARPVAGVDVTAGQTSLAVTARGVGAADVVADERTLVQRGHNRASLSTPCLRDATDVWIAGLDGRVGYADQLFLANPGSTLANVTVTAWSAKGPSAPPRLQSLPLTPGTARVLAVADYTPDVGAVTLHVHANTGRVVAEGLDHRYAGLAPDGSDWVPPTRPPARAALVPGFPGGPGYRMLVVTNPAPLDATVSLRLATPTGSFVPAGHQSVVVASGHSVEVDLSGALNRTPGAVALSSDQPVVAAAVSQEPALRLRADIQWQPAATPLSGPAVLVSNLPPLRQLAQLLLTAPAGPAKVRLSSPFGPSATVSVRAGRTVAAYPAKLFASAEAAFGPLVLTPLSGGPVYASRTLFALGAHGTLITAAQPVGLPTAVELPPVAEDPRAALR